MHFMHKWKVCGYTLLWRVQAYACMQQINVGPKSCTYNLEWRYYCEEWMQASIIVCDLGGAEPCSAVECGSAS